MFAAMVFRQSVRHGRASAGADSAPTPLAAVNSAPIYPRELRVEGRVVVRVRVGVDGRVLSASVRQTSRYPAFDEAALTAIRRWRFHPARRAGRAVESEVNVPVRFRLEDR